MKCQCVYWLILLCGAITFSCCRNAAAILGTLILGRIIFLQLYNLLSGFRAFFLAPHELGGASANLCKYGSWAGKFTTTWLKHNTPPLAHRQVQTHDSPPHGCNHEGPSLGWNWNYNVYQMWRNIFCWHWLKILIPCYFVSLWYPV